MCRRCRETEQIECFACGELVDISAGEGDVQAPPRCRPCGGVWPLVEVAGDRALTPAEVPVSMAELVWPGSNGAGL
jgi:hypothetical protein